MKEFREPEMEIVEIGNDVITASGGCGCTDGGTYESEGL